MNKCSTSPTKPNECFKYNVLALLHPQSGDTKDWLRYERFLDNENPEVRMSWWPDVYLVSYDDIELWEARNRLSVFVYKYIEASNSIYTARIPRLPYNENIHLLEVKGHFFGIKQFNSFMARKSRWYCEKCTTGYRTNEKLDEHMRLYNDVDEIILTFPEEGDNFVKFTQIYQMHPFLYVIALDTESVLEETRDYGVQIRNT